MPSLRGAEELRESSFVGGDPAGCGEGNSQRRGDVVEIDSTSKLANMACMRLENDELLVRECLMLGSVRCPRLGRASVGPLLAMD